MNTAPLWPNAPTGLEVKLSHCQKNYRTQQEKARCVCRADHAYAEFMCKKHTSSRLTSEGLCPPLISDTSRWCWAYLQTCSAQYKRLFPPLSSKLTASAGRRLHWQPRNTSHDNLWNITQSYQISGLKKAGERGIMLHSSTVELTFSLRGWSWKSKWFQNKVRFVEDNRSWWCCLEGPKLVIAGRVKVLPK